MGVVAEGGGDFPETTTTLVKPAGVLTAEFPTAGEMIGWAYSHSIGWLGQHKLLALLLVVVALVWYVGLIIRRAVVSV